MSLEENKSLVRRYHEEMWNRWNLSLADELIGERLAFLGSLGVAVQGREGFKHDMRSVRRAFLIRRGCHLPTSGGPGDARLDLNRYRISRGNVVTQRQSRWHRGRDARLSSITGSES
jgi:hypothetical protein